MSRLHPLLERYRPTAADPFDSVKAAHLYNRAGFGGTLEEIEKAVRLGPEGVVDELMGFPDKSAEEQGEAVPWLRAVEGYPKEVRELRAMFAGKSREEVMELRQKLMAANRQALQEIVHWWLGRMASGPHPLQEKLALFWHGHFTTSARDERSALLIWKQNELLRRQAAGDFGKFVRAISRDPAMLGYLNNQQNRKARPNENYARELLELFTLGIGNYSERDVKEAARAFTGWAHDGSECVFRRLDHDYGQKTFLGRTGHFGGDEIISIILEQRVCARFIAEKIYRFFVHEELEPALGESLGNVLRESGYELRPLLRTIFLSRAFYNPQAIGSQIKSPLQLVVGTARMLGTELPRDRRLAGLLARMGQVPLAPPNVRGWPGGRAWINTSTIFVRTNTAIWLAGGDAPGPARGPMMMMGRGAAARGGARLEVPKVEGGPEQCVEYWLRRLVQRPVAEQKKRTLVDALEGKADDEEAVRRLVQLIVAMPEYQLC